MNGLLVACNLGLGDHIICCGLYRHIAAEEAQRDGLVCIPVKYGNVPSVTYMLRDLPNVVIRPVEDHTEAVMFRDKVWQGRVLNLGSFESGACLADFDQLFYRQANLSFQLRWDEWKVVRDQVMEAAVMDSIPMWTPNDLVFFHDDPSRNLKIDRNRLFFDGTPVFPNHITSPVIFHRWQVLEQASEIHCISSSFALFIDSIDLPKKPKMFLHAYVRAGEGLPTFRQPWEILK